MHQEYPHMLYRDGKVGADHLVVDNPGEEAAAKAQGYLRVGAKPEKTKAKD